MSGRKALTAFLVCAPGLFAAPVAAQEEPEEGMTSLGLDPALGLDPSAPQAGALPGGMAIGPARAADDKEWRFDFHGLIRAPLNVGLNERENRQPGESKGVLHAPPVVPEDLETFSHTGVIPTPYVQLNFSYGNGTVSGNVSMVARQPSVSVGFFDPPSQLGVNDLFLRVVPDISSRVKLELHVGAFSSRYGAGGEYDEGRYDTPLIARINGAGEHVQAAIGFGALTLLLEQGIVGSTSKASSDLTPEGWNDFADPNVGSTFANHLHAGLNYKGIGTLGAHYVHTFSQDDRATGAIAPDGSIGILAADLRLTLGRFGHLYTAISHTKAEDARTVGRVVEVLNTRGGPGLMDEYLGPASGGNGELLTFGGQYDLSIGRLVSYPVPFSGDGPDLFVSVFGMLAKVQSDDPGFDDRTKTKFGVEATYSLLSWLAASARYDQVSPNLGRDRAISPDANDGRYAFSVISPRIIFRTDWQATDQIVLQYSHWMNGSLTTVRTGYPPEYDVRAIPDEDVISLSANMWW
jgi:hypothetical protein